MRNASREFCVAYGEDFSGETVRVLKEMDVRLYGDAPRRTSNLVLEAWDKDVSKDEERVSGWERILVTCGEVVHVNILLYNTHRSLILYTQKREQNENQYCA